MNAILLTSLKLLLLLPLSSDQPKPSTVEAPTNPTRVSNNFMLHVPSDLVRIGETDTVRQSFPVSQCIAGSSVRGSGELTGDHQQQLARSSQSALWNVNFQGTSVSRTRVTQRQVTVRQQGTLNFESSGQVRFDFSGFRTSNTATSGKLRTRTTSISTPFRGFRRRIALRRVREQSGSNRRIAERIGLRDASRSFRKELQTAVGRMNRDYQSQVIQPLVENDIYPKASSVASRDGAVQVGLCFADTAEQSVKSPQDEFYTGNHLRLAVHQAAVNFTSRPLAGESRSLSATLRNVVSGEEVGESESDLRIQFAKESPFEVSFDEQHLTVTLSADGFERAGQVYRGMEISFAYRSEQNEGQQYLVLDKDPLVQPPPDETGKRPKLGLRDVSLRRILVNVLQRDLPQRIAVAELKLPIPAGLFVPLEPLNMRCNDGWLIVEAARKPGVSPQPRETDEKLARAN